MKSMLYMLALAGLLMPSLPAIADDTTKIAFVDTGNTGRSLTAEALAVAFVAEKGLHVAIISRAVDLNPFNVVAEPNAAALLRQRGIDVSAHRAQQLTVNDVRHAEVVLTMTARHREKVLDMFPEARDKTFVLADYASGEAKDVEDAYGKPMAVYETMFSQVEGYLPAAIAKAIAATAKK